MSSRLVRALFLLLSVFASAGPATAARMELKAEGISLPFFDAVGRPTHRLTAERGAMVGGRQKLEKVELVYFSEKDPRQIVQKLVAADAMWDAVKETLTGEGAVEVTTTDNRLTGEGFDFTLATALLHIHHKFTMNNRDATLTSDRARVDLIIEQKGSERKVRDVRRCEAIGNLHIVMRSTPQKRYPFEEAWSTRGIYEGATQIVTFPEPTRYQLQGKLGEAQTMSIDLSEK